MADVVLLKQALPATAYVAPGRWLVEPSQSELERNTVEAQHLLELDGWRRTEDGYRYKNGARLTFVLAIQPSFERIAVWLQSVFRNLGADATIRSYPIGLYYALAQEGGVVRGGNFDMAIVGDYASPNPDVSDNLGCTDGRPNIANFSRFCNAKLDSAIQRMDSAYDFEGRRAAYQTVQEIVSQDAPLSYLYHPMSLTAANSDLQGLQVDALGPFASAAFWTM
jgi:peptide/nickel transport system substrate-binding protein